MASLERISPVILTSVSESVGKKVIYDDATNLKQNKYLLIPGDPPLLQKRPESQLRPDRRRKKNVCEIGKGFCKRRVGHTDTSSCKKFAHFTNCKKKTVLKWPKGIFFGIEWDKFIFLIFWKQYKFAKIYSPFHNPRIDEQLRWSSKNNYHGIPC